MAKASMNFAYYLFLLIICIGEGDGRWKKVDREILQRDIKLYKKIAERLEHELQEYYTDVGRQRFYGIKNDYQSYKNVPKLEPKSPRVKVVEGLMTKENPQLIKPIKVTNDIQSNKDLISNETLPSTKKLKNNTAEKYIRPNSNWPKFEDILLDMGKKYDWKNDRWIKVKEKFKNKVDDVGEISNNNIFHEKHHFSYRRIKLNRGKNKRNIVIAVTAVR